MCGVIGIASNFRVYQSIIDALKRLEYRGYDSCGFAISEGDSIVTKKCIGTVENLVSISKSSWKATCGIGHTRWATHGKASDKNAHPHHSHNVAVIHNGIIENYYQLKIELQSDGKEFISETDTEVIVHLLDKFIERGLTNAESVEELLKILDGAFALLIMFESQKNRIYLVKKGSPLVVGVGEDVCAVGSDAIAVGPIVQEIAYLEDGDWGWIDNNEINIFNTNHKVSRVFEPITIESSIISKKGYSHFMIKEIMEQPDMLKNILNKYVIDNSINLPIKDLERYKKLYIIGCGTSYYAGVVGKYWLEEIAKIPVEVDIASEFRYRSPVIANDSLGIFISQSGETIDTLSAHNLFKSSGNKSIGLVNVLESSIYRAVDVPLLLEAGPEIGVASTKAFIAELTILFLLTLEIAKARKVNIDYDSIMSEVHQLPQMLEDIIAQKVYHDISTKIHHARDVIYLARGNCYPIALEGALKMKEISYIHAEGYPAGELKHGPLALIDQETPVIILAPHNDIFDKVVANIKEVQARGGKVVIVSDEIGCDIIRTDSGAEHLGEVILPKLKHSGLYPIIYTIPMQLIAYNTAVLKGTNVDQPRNLAKSVTVE